MTVTSEDIWRLWEAMTKMYNEQVDTHTVRRVQLQQLLGITDDEMDVLRVREKLRKGSMQEEVYNYARMHGVRYVYIREDIIYIREDIVYIEGKYELAKKKKKSE